MPGDQLQQWSLAVGCTLCWCQRIMECEIFKKKKPWQVHKRLPQKAAPQPYNRNQLFLQGLSDPLLFCHPPNHQQKKKSNKGQCFQSWLWGTSTSLGLAIYNLYFVTSDLISLLCLIHVVLSSYGTNTVLVIRRKGLLEDWKQRSRFSNKCLWNLVEVVRLYL